jgi:hypothetical protein
MIQPFSSSTTHYNSQNANANGPIYTRIRGKMKSRSVLFCSLWLQWNISTSIALQLKTRGAKNPLGNAKELRDFLSRPIHWPQIVASSNKVQSQTMDVTQSMKPGQCVDEVFGMGLLTVSWTCVDDGASQQHGMFVVESPEGVPGIATHCSMTFEIRDDQVDFTMGFTPCSPLAYLATPVLIVDNWLALNVLLNIAVDPVPLNSFRRLMGTLYGVAGLAHGFDLWLGGSVLFASFDIPEFRNLPMEGQALAVVWCGMGPLAYVLSRTIDEHQSSSQWRADLGLALYGLVEVFGALVSGNPNAFANAVGVLMLVGAAWICSQQKQASRQAQPESL